MADPPVALDLALDPAAADRLARLPPLAKLRTGRARQSAVELVWYDTPAGALATDGMSLCERRIGRDATWRLERIRPGPDAPWAPGTAPPLIAEAASPGALGRALPGPLLAVAALSATRRTWPLSTPLELSLLSGGLRTVAGERKICRLLLSGPAAAIAPLLAELALAAPLSMPPVSLAAEAYAIAGRPPPPPALGAPELAAGLTVAEAFCQVVGHLTFCLIHWAPLAAVGAAPEAVHQMRVALRRLRSAMSLFRRAADGAEMDAVRTDLGALSRVLGPARDWDVFCAGTARAVAAQFPDERAVTRLLAAAERRRLAAYATLATHLASPAFRLLGLRLAGLAALRRWDRDAAPDDDEAAAKQARLRSTPLADFAARALTHRLARLRPPDGDFVDLPVEALHALRIQAKRLRYAGEFFAPLFPRKETKRFLRRLAALQEDLGHLNDGAVAATLMADLQIGGGGERAMAVGIVRGFVAAGARDARADSDRRWRRLHRLEPFWR